MSLSINVRSRHEIKSIFPKEPFAIISICDPGDDSPLIIINSNLKYSHKIVISDIDDPEFAKRYGYVIFNKDQAKAVITFIQYIIENNIKTLYIHCNAGICRSPGLAAALDVIFNKVSYSGIFSNPNYKPSYHIYTTMLNVANEMGLYPIYEIIRNFADVKYC